MDQTGRNEQALLSEYLSQDEVARELNVSPRTLQRWRRIRTGPPVTIISRAPFYRRTSVQAWLLSREVKSS